MHCNVQGYNLNPSCRLPGSPFRGELLLFPNAPPHEPAAVTFGPVRLVEGVDTFAFVFSSPARAEHQHVLAAQTQLLDTSAGVIAEARRQLRRGEHAAMTLTLDGPRTHVGLRVSAAFDRFEGAAGYGPVRLLSLVAYEDNLLVRLCNEAGSDKGTATFGTGTPHCYAVEYHHLFSPFREERFRMLEIGLDNASKVSGTPTDAPSLRVWRDYLPAAQIYGYDINDFSFFAQDGTVTFQGDQGSREDIQRFLSTTSEPSFRLVIDDGSHAASHQQISLGALFPHVEPGGFYVIEDLHWQPFPETPTTAELLRRFLATGDMSSQFMTEPESRYLKENVADVRFHKPNLGEFAIIRKRA